jgi:hypothetical protein
MSDEDKMKKKATVEKEWKDAPVAPPAQAPVVIPVVKKMSFEQWATNRSIPPHHFGGMKAWIKNANVPRTEEAWDLAFVGY